MSRSNRLLDMFQAEAHQDTTTKATVVVGVRPNAVSMASSHATDLGRASRGEKRETTSGMVGTKTSETKLERENGRLREQLKFQGAVLDQLAGDVHTLERQRAVSTRPQPPSDGGKEGARKHTEEEDAAPLTSDNSGSGGLALGVLADPAPDVLTLPSPGSDGRHESARLRRELDDSREAVEGLRREVAAERKAAEESGQTQVDLLCRERKFRAAVEAGLREKVHSTRQRSRDREERLSAELSFARRQLKETVGLLASKEEGLCLARTQKADQEENAAAALARLKERDRHAHWLERRLSEVLSGEAAAATLCMEEMTASLVAQQQELESLRATKQNQSTNRECSSASREGRDGGCAATPTQKHEEVALGEGIPECVELSSDDCTAEVEPAPAPETEQRCVCTQGSGAVAVEATDIPCSGEKDASARDSKKSKQVLGKKSVALFNKCAAMNGPQPQRSPPDGHVRAESSDAPIGRDVGVQMSSPGMPSASEVARAARSSEIVEWLLTPPSDKASVSPRLLREQPCSCDHSSSIDSALQNVRVGLSAALSTKTSPGVTSKIVRQRVQTAMAKERVEHEKQLKEWQRLESGWETRLAALEEELARLRGQGGEWEREAVGLKVERQAMLRRLRKLDQEAEEKTRTVTELREAASALRSELTECRDARKGLQRELTQHVQARRVLEKRAKCAEESVSEAVVQTAKAERAKTLLKARLAAASRRNKKKPKVGAEAGTEGCPPSDNGTASTRSGVSGSATTDSACRDGGREGREQTTAAAAAAVKGRDEAERQLGVTRSSLEEALAHVKRLEEQLQEARGASRGQRQDAAAQHAQHHSEQETNEVERALGQAEMRVVELERAWGALAAKVVSLADRNAELEWAILRLRRGQSHVSITSSAPCCGDALFRVPRSIATGGDDSSMTSDITSKNDDLADVPRAQLDLGGLLGRDIGSGEGLGGDTGGPGRGGADDNGGIVLSEGQTY